MAKPIGISVVLVLGIGILLLAVCRKHSVLADNANRTFIVDYEHDQFVIDGKPIQLISGEVHYFRAVPGMWRRIFRAMRSGGLNAVATYVEWSLHNPKDGVFTWDGIADLERFVEEAEEEGLLVILRPGPYICAERDNVITLSILKIYSLLEQEILTIAIAIPGRLSILAVEQVSGYQSAHFR